MNIRPTAALLIVLVAAATTSLSQTPLGTAFTYQGRLKSGGSPANGSFNMDFKLYPVPAGGTLLASQTLPGVSVTDGLFTVQVDFGAGVFDGNQRWLDVTVDGTPLSPRQELTAAPNALFALNADRLDGLDSTAFLQSIPNPLTLSGTSTTHIIRGENASSNGGASGVYGLATAGTGFTYGGRFESASTVGRGVFGQATAATGFTYGVEGLNSSTSGGGVLGLAFAYSGATYGGRFESASTSGCGVFGSASPASGVTHGGRFESYSTSGRGVFGFASAGTGSTYGVYGQSDSTTGLGVYGRAGTGSNWTNFNAPAGVWGDAADGNGVLGTGTNGTGVAGVSTFGRGVFASSQSGDALEAVASGQNRTAVYGHHDGATGPANGVLGQSASTGGRGVFGQATAATGTTTGVWAQSASTSGRGVFGWAFAPSGNTIGVFGRSDSETGYGVYGLASAISGTIYGVAGQSYSPSGWGVYSWGNMGASGTKSFRIDHPDDPANKYLLHYAAESPEVINFYSGKATLDAAGEAVVELPHYFAKINKDPRYMLTAVGAPMPMLHVAEEINEAALSAGATAGPGVAAPICSFRIAGGAPGAKVCWRVEALRNDLWVRNRAEPVEVEKQDLERGTYQHPELYGQPPEMGMNYDAQHERPSRARPDRPAEAMERSPAPRPDHDASASDAPGREE